MDRPRLHGTPLSHFTRKIRILLAELGVDHEFVRAPGVLAAGAAAYGDNPLMRVPTLIHGAHTLIESDHIARYLVGRYDPSDRLGVRSERVDDLNRLAVANGVMNNEVVLLLARRGGLADLEGVAYFRKLRTAIDQGLTWLDGRTDPDADGFDYADIVTVCLWQHLVYYAFLPGLEDYPRIAARVARLAGRPSVAATAPAASLAEAEAAGWRPA
jgi:glutathione S-transferase